MESARPLDPVWLSQRLDVLERAHRRLKRAVAAGFLGLAAFGVMGQALPKSKVVEAERFIVRDQAGVARVELGIFFDPGIAGPVLRLRDSTGQVRAGLLTVTEPGGSSSALFLADAAGQLRAGLSAGADGSAHLSLGDAANKNRAVLEVGPQGLSA